MATKIVLNRAVPAPSQQLWVMNRGRLWPDADMTFPPGFNLFANWSFVTQINGRARRCGVQNVKRMPSWPVRGTAPARSAV